MYGRRGFGLLLLLVIVIGAVLIGAGAYQAGLDNGAAQVATGAAGAPVVVPYYGHPFGFGFGFLGFLGTLLFIFLIFAVIRALAFGGRGRGWGGPGRWGGGYGGPGPDGHSWRGSPWESRAHEVFDEWHRDAHGDKPASPATSSTGQTGQA